jgi:hypothetical protein
MVYLKIIHVLSFNKRSTTQVDRNPEGLSRSKSGKGLKNIGKILEASRRFYLLYFILDP